jgi:hypothetical protein
VRSGVAQTVRALLGFALSFALAVSAHAKETVIERFFNEDGERVVVKATETFLRHSGAKAFAVRYSERYAGGKGPAPVGNRDGTNETDDDGSFELNFDEHWSGGRAFAISVAGAMCPKGAASCSSGVTIHLFDDPSTAKSDRGCPQRNRRQFSRAQEHCPRDRRGRAGGDGHRVPRCRPAR